MVTDKKALYLAAWYLTRPHWVFLSEAAESMARSSFVSAKNIFSAVGEVFH
jgi:hypothetical protein